MNFLMINQLIINFRCPSMKE